MNGWTVLLLIAASLYLALAYEHHRVTRMVGR